ncbi:hypothetical protein Dimus_037474, partial [Dionaea muscipula]
MFSVLVSIRDSHEIRKSYFYVESILVDSLREKQLIERGGILVDRMRGGTVDRLSEDLSVLLAEHDRPTWLQYHSGRP